MVATTQHKLINNHAKIAAIDLSKVKMKII